MKPHTDGRLHIMDCGPVLQRDHLDTATDYSSAMQPLAQCLLPYLGQTRDMLASVYHGNPLQDVPSTPITTSHMTQGGDHVG
jgi:hypothetical protein